LNPGEATGGERSRRPEAVLLLGPTGSGKTPLGRILATRGLSARRVLHFDFGDRLRRAAAESGTAPTLTAAERQVVLRVLAAGALLENEEFAIAEKILGDFLAATAPGGEDILALNGLPRDTGQAERLAGRFVMRAVVILEATTETLMERIRLDAGRDRGGRSDDEPSGIRAKLELYASRTLPLVAYYENRGAAMLKETVRAADSGETLYDRLAARLDTVLKAGSL
jgi:adenylate kinase